ncbi:MAG: branched-chain amino acid ABC transporter ATP-binding protein/permease [Dermatophilaceae bacterium]
MRWVKALWPFALLTAILVVFPLVAPEAIVDIGVYALIYGLAAIGLSLLMGLAGQVSLGHAAFFAVGAYTQAIFLTKTSVPGPVAAVVAVLLAMLVALLVGLPLLRLRGHFLALATLGLGIIVGVVVRELDVTGGQSGIYGIPRPELGGQVIGTGQEFFWFMTPFVVIGLAVAVNLVRSRTGRALGAVNDSEVAAECLGVDTFALRLRVFVLSAAYAGLAGVFYAHWLTVVNPSSAHFELSVQILLMVVLGGLGSVTGALVGSVAVQALDEFMRQIIPVFLPKASGEIQLIGFGVVLVLLIILLPGGLASLWNAIGRRIRAALAARRTPDPAVGADAQPVALDAALAILSRQKHQPRGTTILQIRGLTKRYGGVTALADLDLDVHAGEILALIGPNGAGKTTAFNMVTGVLEPTEGSVVLHGTEVAGRQPHVAAALGATRTFQNLQTFKSTTVLGNVKVARHLRSRAGIVRGMLGLARSEERAIESASHAALSAMGLSAFADRPIADLAFGQQRQVEVARALALEPSVLLLDEPMAGLSGAERDALSALLRKVREAGVTVLLVEHDVAAVMALADRVAVLDDGRLISLGTPAEVTSDPAVIAAYLGTDEHDEELVRTAAAHTQGVDDAEPSTSAEGVTT